MTYSPRFSLVARWGVLLAVLWVAGAAWAQDALVKQVTIRGNSAVREDAITAIMRTRVDRPYQQATLDADKRSIEDMGFFKAVDIRGRAINDREWEVLVDVVEFDKILEIRVVGNDDKAVKQEEILAAMSLKVGNIYNLKMASADGRSIEEMFAKKGFFAQVADVGPLEDSPNTLNVAIIILTVNSITVTGNTKTSDSIMRRLIKTRPGDTFSIPKWQRDLRRIYGTQWFESIEPGQAEPEIGKLDLTLAVKETRTGNVDFGVQVDPRSRFAGLVRFRDSNFRGTGQSLGVEFIQATTGRGLSVGVDYTHPFLDSKDTSLSVSVYSRESYRFSGNYFGGGGNASDSPTGQDYSERRTGATVGVGRPFNDALVGTVQARMETIKTLGSDEARSSGFIQQDGDLASLQFGLTWNRRDVDIDPSRGDWFRVAVEPGYSNIKSVGGLVPDTSVLGNKSFIRSYVEYRRYWSDQPVREKFDDPRRVLALRLRYGIISGDVPFFEQFFAGGSNTLRGYSDDRFWGKETATATLEYRYPIQKSFNVVAHVDYGGAWNGYVGVNDFKQYKRPKMLMGYGLGLSFKTPLGPIRLDFSFNENGGNRTHFIIGSSF